MDVPKKREFIKLKDIERFTVKESHGYKWKMWDEQTKKMLVSDGYQEGHSKRYSFVVDGGNLELSSSQVGQMLEGVFEGGTSDVRGKTFSVRTNGKTGKEIRYWINPVFDVQPPLKKVEPPKEDEPPVEAYAKDLPFN